MWFFQEIEHLSHEELLNLLLSADKTIKQKDGKIKAYEALIGTLITSVADEKAKIGQLKREKEGMEEVNQQMVERIEKMKEALIEGAEVITRQGMIIEHFRDVVIERPRRRERRDDNPRLVISW